MDKGKKTNTAVKDNNRGGNNKGDKGDRGEDYAETGLPQRPKLSPQEARFLLLNRRKRGTGREKKRFG